MVLEADESLQKVSSIASQVKMLKKLPDVDVRTELVDRLQREIKSLRQNPEVIAKNIEISFDSDDLDSLTASITEAELSRVLQNLIQNAVHASVENSKIQVSIKKSGSMAAISVKDQGHGIPIEIQ